jgi:hypothetical protein
MDIRVENSRYLEMLQVVFLLWGRLSCRSSLFKRVVFEVDRGVRALQM